MFLLVAETQMHKSKLFKYKGVQIKMKHRTLQNEKLSRVPVDDSSALNSTGHSVFQIFRINLAYSLLHSTLLNYLAMQNQENIATSDRMNYPFVALIHSCASLIYPISFRTWQVTHFITDTNWVFELGVQRWTLDQLEIQCSQAFMKQGGGEGVLHSTTTSLRREHISVRTWFTLSSFQSSVPVCIHTHLQEQNVIFVLKWIWNTHTLTYCLDYSSEPDPLCTNLTC